MKDSGAAQGSDTLTKPDVQHPCKKLLTTDTGARSEQ